MSQTYDAIVIGGGHNGLVAAAYLARAGQRVLVLERRQILGGAAATESPPGAPGFRFNTGAHDAGLFRPEIVADLNLTAHGLTFLESPAITFAPQPDGTALTLWRDLDRTVAEIARISPADAARFPAFHSLVGRLSQVLAASLLQAPPSPAERDPRALFPWLKIGLKLRRLGRQDMMEFLRVMPLSVAEFLDGWFESDVLKGSLGAAAIAGSMQGPRASGTSLMLLYHHLGSPGGALRASRFVRGGMGQLSLVLAEAASRHGAEILTGAPVTRILVQDYQARGVVLADGEELGARTVISNADPRRTFFDLVGGPQLPLQFLRRVQNIRFRGSTAKVNLALSGLPEFRARPPDSDDQTHLAGHILLSPGLDYLERAYDDAKYGRFSQAPVLDVVIPSLLDPMMAPTGQHVMSISMQYAPYRLRDGDWETKREVLGDHVLEALAASAPNLKQLILDRQVLSPLDWERDYGLTEGSIYHGQMGLDQLFFMRPVPGYGRYRTPIDNLYLCGAGTHPGGGVSGAPGYNAAREVLRDLKAIAK